MSTTIRSATDADLPRCAAMGSAFLRHTQWGTRVEDDRTHFQALARTVMEQGRLFVAEVAGAVVGMLGMMVITHPVTNLRIGAEVIWWVEPDARRSGAGQALFAAAEQWAKDEGAVAAQFSAYRDAVLERLYRRLGYRPQEIVFQKEL